MSSLSDEEPLLVMKVGIDVMWEVIGEDGRNGGNSVIWKWKTPLCRGRGGNVTEGLSCAQDRDVSHNGRVGGRWWSEVFPSRGSNIDVVRIHSDVVVEWGEKEGVENFLGDARRSGRHV